jgi:predicted TIM-barrel fold metal-dependent hydrolase
MSALVAEHAISAWKVYTHAPGPGWRLDDGVASAPQVGEAFLARVEEVGPRIVCVHKGFSDRSVWSSPADIGPAARAHPDISFVVYHSGYEAIDEEGPYSDAVADVGVNRLVKTLRDAGVGAGANVYAELGSTWWRLMRDPTQAAHVLGKLLQAVGPDRIVWGTDSLWYGSPQDQIQAFRAFEIAAELQDRHGYPALTPEVKRKILGQNAIDLYGIEQVPDRCTFTRDELAALRVESTAAWRTFGPTTDRELAAVLRDHGMT